jgi:transcriptional regulator with XRE-family HTH domain
MTREGLAKEARKARVGAGLSQSEIAERVDVDRSAISKAENWQKGDGFTSLRKRIIEEITGKEVEGPFYKTADE